MTVMPPIRSAAEIAKGEIAVHTLSEAEVISAIAPQALLDGLAAGFRAVADGLIQSPARPEITVPGKGFSLAMPAWGPGRHIMVKVVNVFEGNLDLDLPNHLAMITLFAPDTGLPVCVMDGTHITGIRTAASAVLSVRELARPDARVATLIGAGVQGREHLGLLPLARDFDEIRIASLRFEDAERLARSHPRAVAVCDVEAAVRGSDVVCLASHAYEPVIDPAWLKPGTHVSSVGYAPPRGELPRDLPRRHTLYVETSDAFQPTPVGCAELTGMTPDQGIALGDMLTGRKPGRVSDDQITVYKAMGIAMEDMVAAEIAFAAARTRGIGRRVMF